MKKIFSMMILILSAFMCFACGKAPIISYAKENITINIDQVCEVDDGDIKIENYDGDYKLYILDEAIAKVDGNKIIPQRPGQTFVRIQLNKKKYYLDVKLIITNNINATSASVQFYEMDIDINQTQTAINKLTLNKGCNEVPQVLIDKDIITYDYITGKIEVLATGVATVRVRFKSCSVTFRVNVTGVIYVRDINVFDVSLFEGQEGVFEIAVFPFNANTYYFECESDLLWVNEDGTFVAYFPGSARVTVYYDTSEQSGQTKTFNVVILEKDTDFEVAITDENGGSVERFYKEQKYKITVSGVDEISNKKLAEIRSISIVETYENNDSIVIYFYFAETGKLFLDFRFCLEDTIAAEKQVEVMVYSFEDYSIKAKWITNTIHPDEEGNYHIYINSQTLNTYIVFSLYFQGEKMDGGYVIKNFEGIEISNTFKPTDTGTYALSFVVGKLVVKSVNVIVS